MLEQIGEYLATQNVGTLAEDIFLGNMPDMPDACVVLYQYAGSPPDLHWNGEYPGLQVKVRAATYSAASTKIKAVVRELHGLCEQVLGGTRYLLVKAKGSPELWDKDDKGRVILFVNFEVMKEAN